MEWMKPILHQITWFFTNANNYVFDDNIDVNTGDVLIETNRFVGVDANNNLIRDGTNGIMTLKSQQDVSIIIDSDGNASIETFRVQNNNLDPDSATDILVIDEVGTMALDGTINFAADAQVDDDYEIAIPTIAALVTGLTVTWTATTANTGGATLEITSVGDLDAILKMNDQALVTGDIEAGQVVVTVFDGTNWQMISQLAQ